MMKVSILTQPLGRNYGGLLQAYALQVTLKKLGCDVETLNRRRSVSFKAKLLPRFKLFVKKLLGQLGVQKFRGSSGNPYVNLENFRDQFISVSPLIDSNRKILSYYSKSHFDALIVGSDQVWRPRYSPELGNYFLDFCDELNLNSKRIAYAASFGVDDKEFSEEEVETCRPFARRFNDMSVREDSGVDLLKDYFGVDSQVVFDPTLLLDTTDYEYVIERDSSAKMRSTGGVLAYILDMDDTKEGVVTKVCGATGETPEFLMNSPTSALAKEKQRSECYPRVGDWLNSFKSAKFVVTDSFHGCVFSIVFNKPFLVIGNKSRGLARFTSLLKKFGLEARLIVNCEQFDSSLAFAPIDWELVNNLRSEGRLKSLEFLRNCLSL